MKPGQLAAIGGATLAVLAVAFVFTSNASPYVTVAEAKQMDANNLHLAGAIDQSSLRMDYNRQTATFILTDDTGASVQVRHEGIPEGNISQAVRVVAIGGMKDGVFVSHKMLLKCPSKYASEGNPVN